MVLKYDVDALCPPTSLLSSASQKGGCGTHCQLQRNSAFLHSLLLQTFTLGGFHLISSETHTDH